jgi:hypothetical protein
MFTTLLKLYFLNFCTQHPLNNGNIAANLPQLLPCVCRLYGKTIATYYENVHRWQTWKMERNKKNIWHPFHFGKIAGNQLM